jgi:hypothetical protein
MKPKRSSLSKTLHEWADVTTAHGFFDLFNVKSIIAMIIWFFLVAVSLTLMTYQLYSVISDYSRGLWASNVQDTPTGLCCCAVQSFYQTLEVGIFYGGEDRKFSLDSPT